MTNPKSASEAGCKLYHAVWEVVGANFFDKERLADWPSWEHRFDSLIVDEESALPYCDQMLASLNDPYTERVVSLAVSTAENSATASAPASAQPASVLSVLSSDNIGYLRILDFDREEIFQEVEAAAVKIAGCDGLVLDLRHNSGGRMHRAIQTSALLIENGLITTVELAHEKGGVTLRHYYVNADQFFCIEVAPDGTEKTESYERPAPILAGKPLVLLINRRTASAAEMVSCAVVQNGLEGKLLIVGGVAAVQSQGTDIDMDQQPLAEGGITAGKGIGQAEFDILEGKLTIRITRSRWLAPGGDWVGDCGQTVRNGLDAEIVVPGDRGQEALKIAMEKMRAMLGRDAS